MARISNQVDVYLEIGKSRVFATAIDWPGWSRSGADEASALQALFAWGPRYAQALEAGGVAFSPPAEISDLIVVERLAGNVTTDFGAPNLSLAGDTQPVDPAELQHFQSLLQACWKTLDLAVSAAKGRTLRKGPRGGGRDLEKIVEHVYGVDEAYLRSLGGKAQPAGGDPNQALSQLRQNILSTLGAAARGEVPERGQRGGLRWTPRYFVRRLAWHELDHAWEIEARAE